MASASTGFGSGVCSQAYYLSREQLSGSRQLRRSLISSTMSHRSNLDGIQLTGHFGCVNAINFSNKGGQFIVSGGDDKRVLLWRTEEAASRHCQPITLRTEHASNIFSAVFDNSNEHVYSAGNDEVVLRHSVERQVAVDIFPHRRPVYGVSVDPDHDGVIVSAGDDGRVLLWDTRMPDSPCKCVARSVRPFHAAAFHPVEPRFVATANAGDGVALWDVRRPHRCLMTYGGYLSRQKAMSVVFNRSGDQLLALRRRLPAVLYHVEKLLPVCQFTHDGYVNSCTMKSACFCGDNDQYVASGSDNFNVFIWKIPDAVFHDPLPGDWVSEAQCVLVGHRSIVNQVRFNPHSMYLISSGVEKAMRLWSPFAISGEAAVSTLSKKMTTEEESARQRRRFTLREQRQLVLSNALDMGSDIHTSTEEDSHMLAFFDSLLQQDESSDGVSGSSLDAAIVGIGLDNESQNSDDESDMEAVESRRDTQREGSSRRGVDAQGLLSYFLSVEYSSSTNSDNSSSTSQSSVGGYRHEDGEAEHLFAPSSPSSCEEDQLVYGHSPIRGSDISEGDSSPDGDEGHEEQDGINGLGSISDSAHQLQASSCISTCNHQSTGGEPAESEVTTDSRVCTDSLVLSVDSHADCQRHETNGLTPPQPKGNVE